MRSIPIVRAALFAAPLVTLLTACDEKVVVEIDDVPPEIEITSPATNENVSGVSVLVSADATDDVGVDRVEFRVEGRGSVADSDEPFSLRVATLAEAPSERITIVAEAFDTSENSTEASIDVFVSARTITRLTNDPNDDMNPSFSPSGETIVFQAKRAVGRFDVWRMNVDGSDQVQLTTNLQDDRNPAYSPDGQWIVFDSDRMGTYDIFRMPVETGEADLEALTFGNNDDIQPTYTVDGLTVLFASNRGDNSPFNIWSVPATGGDSNALQLTSFLENDTAPAVSSDGLSFAFSTSLNFLLDHVYTSDFGSDTVAPLTGNPGFSETDPSWTPRGGAVLFSRDAGLDSNLWIQVPGGVAPLQVTFGSGLIGDGGGVWSPDGSRIAFHSDRDGNPEIYVME